MLDPITSLTVATSTVQFLDFGAKLITRIYDIHQAPDGNIDEFQQIASAAEMLRKLSAGLTTTLSRKTLRRQLTTQEQDIAALSKQCEETAVDLISILGRILPGNGKVGAWKASFQAIKILWKQKDVDHLRQRLGEYTQLLSTNLLVDIQQKVSDSNRASALSQSSTHSDWEGTQSVTAWLAEQSKEMRKWQENLLDAVERNNYNLLRRVEGLAHKSRPADLFQSWGESKIRENVIDAFLDKLRYQELSDRHDRISAPFPKTFDWILESGGDSKAQVPTNFKDWLGSENTIYWISGKAGSGKSTLMKSIYHDPRTKSLLLTWGGDTPLIMAAFFFWNSGTKLQMSQEGLLRSILFQALSQRRALSAKSLPSKWDAFSLSLTYSAGLGIPKPWKWTELAQALRFLVEGEDDISVKYVFFIDGLDELDGDTSKLVSLIDRLTQYKNVKVCVSSRPWVEFEDTFGSGATVKLHEHIVPAICCGTPPPPPSCKKRTWILVDIKAGSRYGYQLTRLNVPEKMPKVCKHLLTTLIEQSVMKEG